MPRFFACVWTALWLGGCRRRRRGGSRRQTFDLRFAFFHDLFFVQLLSQGQEFLIGRQQVGPFGIFLEELFVVVEGDLVWAVKRPLAGQGQQQPGPLLGRGLELERLFVCVQRVGQFLLGPVNIGQLFQ